MRHGTVTKNRVADTAGTEHSGTSRREWRCSAFKTPAALLPDLRRCRIGCSVRWEFDATAEKVTGTRTEAALAN
jgi:hypothetical protein